MPTVTITLTDTPTGSVAIAHDFKPAIGAPCSRAQAAAMDVINITRKHYGMPTKDGVDIDAVHRRPYKADEAITCSADARQ